MAEEELISPAMMAAPEDESDDIYGGIYHNPGLRNQSRLSACTSSFTTNESYDLYEENDVREGGGGEGGGYSSLCPADDEGGTEAVESYFSMMSIENFDADAEFEEEEEEEEEGEGERLSSFSSCSMLGSSPREEWRARRGMVASKDEYASDEEAPKDKEKRTKKKKKAVGFGGDRVSDSGSGRWGGQNCSYGGDGESECGSGGGGGGGGVVAITRAMGGKRRLRMDMEEVKACRELGLELELERERTIEIPGRISLSGSVDTGSSGGNSPIANWRISSPGDDPRDVKARLKVWAQMVALASSSLHSN